MQSDFETVQDEYSISCDPARLDLAVVHGFHSTSQAAAKTDDSDC
jgi:hypothetical protein